MTGSLIIGPFFEDLTSPETDSTDSDEDDDEDADSAEVYAHSPPLTGGLGGAAGGGEEKRQRK